MTLDDLLSGEAATAFAFVASIATLWWRSARAVSALDRRIDSKPDASVVEAIARESRERCVACRREVDAEIAEQAAEASRQREAISVIQAKLDAIGQRIDERFSALHEAVRDIKRAIEKGG